MGCVQTCSTRRGLTAHSLSISPFTAPSTEGAHTPSPYPRFEFLQSLGQRLPCDRDHPGKELRSSGDTFRGQKPASYPHVGNVDMRGRWKLRRSSLSLSLTLSLLSLQPSHPCVIPEAASICMPHELWLGPWHQHLTGSVSSRLSTETPIGHVPVTAGT